MSQNRAMNTKTTALGAMLVALSVVLLYIGSITEILDLSLCAVASLVAVFALIEFGRGYALTVYSAAALLSLLILPNKFSALAYVFMALYSIIKSVIERLGRIASWIVKLVYFNAGLIIAVLLAKYIFLLPDEGMIAMLSLFVLGNAAFILFDIALSRLVLLYFFRLRTRLRIDKYIGRFVKK